MSNDDSESGNLDRMSEDERERFIDDAAARFARLFLDQVLWQREEKNKKTDN